MQHIMLNQDQIDALVAAVGDHQMYLDEDGTQLRTDYSGRGMFSATCLGLETDAIIGDVIRLALAVQQLVNDSDDSVWLDVAAELTDARQDSMGLGSIAYWPTIGVEEGVVAE